MNGDEHDRAAPEGRTAGVTMLDDANGGSHGVRPARVVTRTAAPPSLFAHVAGWLLVTAAVVAARRLDPASPSSTGGFALEAVHAAHAVVGGVLSWVITAFYVAWLRRRAPRDLASLSLMHGVLCYALFAADVARRAALLARSVGGSALLWGVGLAFLVGGVVVMGALALAALARRGRLFAVATLALAFAAAILARQLPQVVYPGARLAAQVALAIGAASALGELVGPSSPRRRGVLVVAVVVPASAVLLLPLYETVTLRRALGRDDGCALAPVILRARSHVERAWMDGGSDRRVGLSGPAVDPTRPPLVESRVPIVVLITIDAFRADVAFSGRHDERLPNLARLRDASVAFSRARSVAPSTFATIDAIFSGRLLGDRGAKDEAALLAQADDGGQARLGDLLRSSGVRTTVVESAGWLAPSFGFCGAIDAAARPEVDARAKHARADAVATALTDEVARHPEGAHFLYTHLLDAHEPYDLAGPEGTPFERYLRELAQVDAAVGRIARFLDEPPWRGRSVLIVSADHGESFGEHGAFGHAAGVYEDAVRVPLFVRAPGIAPRHVDDPVTVLDLAPTILDVFGAPTPGTMRGVTLVPALRGEALPRRSIPIESGLGVVALVLPEGIKVSLDTRTNTWEVYDLTTDPLELDDLVSAGRAPPAARAALEAFFGR